MCASGNDCKGDLSVACLDMFEDLRYCLQRRQVCVEQFFLAPLNIGNRHAQSMALIKCGDDLHYRHSTPCVEQIFGELAAPLSQNTLPCDVVERHRIGDRAITVEQVSLELS